MQFRLICQNLLLCFLILQTSCRKQAPAESASETVVPVPTSTPSCDALAGTSWVPSISGVSVANHDDSSVTVTKDIYTGSGLLTGLGQSYSANSSHVITISGIDVSTDLLLGGSATLVAQTTGFPSSLSDGAYPVLISLNDGVNELVNVSGCTSGFYTCLSGNCNTPKVGCGPDPNGTGGSAFLGATAAERRSFWDQGQRIGTNDFLSVNTFPTCNWSSGTPSCSFNSSPGSFFAGSGKLRSGSGVTYTAKYVLLTSSYSSVGDSFSAGIKLTVVRKKDGNQGATNGATDLNVILVGTKNITQSRTDKGKQNLDALFTHVYNHYFTQNSSTTGIKLGKINVIEWDCTNGGDSYATVDLSKAGQMFSTGSALLPSSTETKALNIFLVSSITYSGSGTILGLSGGIPGAMINGTSSSGLVFSSLNKLGTYNPSCSSSGTCTISSQEPAFIDMGSTISHEMGHFMGLNHLSERDGSTHDKVPDTPQCTTLSGGHLTISSCRSESSCNNVCSSSQYASGPYCSDKTECQFNHVMWWTSKNYNSSGQGDGNIFSTNSSSIINYSPYVQ